MLIVKGQNLGTCGVSVASSFPLKATMGTTSMKITIAGNTYNILMYYVVACQPNAPDQLAGVVPSNIPTGNGTITVTMPTEPALQPPLSLRNAALGFTPKMATGPGVP